MGIFYTVYYAAMMLGPVVGGACAKWTGSGGGGLRLRRGHRAALPARCCCGLQPDCHSRDRARARASAPDATAANVSLTLSALGSA